MDIVVRRTRMATGKRNLNSNEYVCVCLSVELSLNVLRVYVYRVRAYCGRWAHTKTTDEWCDIYDPYRRRH